MKRVLVGLIFTLPVLVFQGCAEKQDIALLNLPPETYLAVSDTVRHVTSYSQTLKWWGTDADGEVVGFEYRWFTDPSEQGCQMDTLWHLTQETSASFDLPVTREVSTHRIEVRAVDDDDERDPTPSSLTLPVTNAPPEVSIWDFNALPETTLASLSVRWHGTDPDGDQTIAGYLVWLDGDRESAVFLAFCDTLLSIGLDAFKGDMERERTLNIVAIDSGCDTSEVATYTWYVKEPVGSVLLVDDLSSDAGAAEIITDSFYRLGLDFCDVPYSLLDLESFGGIPYAHNFRGAFEPFDLVVWYNGPLKPDSPNLSAAEDAVRGYVESGGRFLLQSLSAVGSGSSLSDSLFFEVFGIDSLYLSNGSTNFDCKKSWIILGNSEAGLDSVKSQSIFPGVECMKPEAGAISLYYIRPGTVNRKQEFPYYLGILNDWSGGKASLLTFPLSRCDGYGNARDEYCKIVDMMLYGTVSMGTLRDDLD